jgi:hypothetical protein
VASFYLDNNVSTNVIPYLQAAGHEARAAVDLHAERLSDDQHLLLAARNHWILITHNRRDFVLLHGAWRRWSHEWAVTPEHAGILVLPQGLRYGVEWSEALIAREASACADAHILVNRLYVRWNVWFGWTDGDWRLANEVGLGR